MREPGTLVERLRARLARRPFDVWRGVQEWKSTPNADLVWAWFADHCGIYETTDSTDPIELARSEGMREAFFALHDLGSTHGDDILDIQRRAVEGGES